MRYLPNQVHLEGHDRFEPGQEYDVDEDRVRYFVSHGRGTAPDLQPEPGAWSEPVTVTTGPAEAVTLQPHDAVQGQESDLV